MTTTSACVFRPSDIDFALPYHNGTKPFHMDASWPPLVGMFGEVEMEIFIAIIVRVCQRHMDTFDCHVSRSLALATIPNNYTSDKAMRRDVMGMSIVDWNFTARGAKEAGWCTVIEPPASQRGLVTDIEVTLTPACIEHLRKSMFSRVSGGRVA